MLKYSFTLLFVWKCGPKSQKKFEYGPRTKKLPTPVLQGSFVGNSKHNIWELCFTFNQFWAHLKFQSHFLILIEVWNSFLSFCFLGMCSDLSKINFFYQRYDCDCNQTMENWDYHVKSKYTLNWFNNLLMNLTGNGNIRAQSFKIV